MERKIVSVQEMIAADLLFAAKTFILIGVCKAPKGVIFKGKHGRSYL